MWDSGLITAYAYALSWFAVAAFARLAGLGRGDQVPAASLNTMCRALSVAICSDLQLSRRYPVRPHQFMGPTRLSHGGAWQELDHHRLDVNDRRTVDGV